MFETAVANASDAIIGHRMQIRAHTVLTKSVEYVFGVCGVCVHIWTQRAMNEQPVDARTRPVYHFEHDINYFVNENI